MLTAGLLFLLVFSIEMVGDVAEDHEWNRRIQGYPLGRVKPDQKAGGQAGDKGKPRRERIEGVLNLSSSSVCPSFSHFCRNLSWHRAIAIQTKTTAKPEMETRTR